VVVVAREDDAQLARPGVVLLEQAEGADLLEPHVHRPLGVRLLEADGVLDALLAAGPRAVKGALFEGAGTEDETHRAGLGEALVAGGEQLLEVEAGDDPVALAEAVELGARLLRAGGHDHDTVVDGGALAVGGGDDAREVADEAVEVFRASPPGGS